ncbi:MAG: 2-amino-4-hydroxy-6-hydroxymethyldihydropteridine diphosphokinase [Chloroflexota bacterium]|nr:2-amino-4-hydroxy-6-hydroxymethyldihydropteridine diphosphokinase [Chloroflexota bacterium]
MITNNDETHLVCLVIGSNLSPGENLPKSVSMLRRYVDIKLLSMVWESPDVGGKRANYLNAAILIETNLFASNFKKQVLRSIEAALGRLRTDKKGCPCAIDLDILIFDGIIINCNLWRFAFLAVPIAEIYPNIENPLTNETLKDAALRLSQQTEILLRPDVRLLSQ